MSIRLAAAPVQLAGPVQVVQQMPVQMPVPMTQTKDMPDPQAVAAQKDQYAKSLEQQLQNGQNQIIAENAQKKKALNDAAAHQKSMYILQVDQEVKKQEMMLDQEMAKKLHDLQKAAHDQRAILEQQAATLTMEYNTKKAQEQFEQQQHLIQKTYEEEHAKIHAAASKLQPAMQQVQQVQQQPVHQVPMQMQQMQQVQQVQHVQVQQAPVHQVSVPSAVPVQQMYPGAPQTTVVQQATPGASYAAAPMTMQVPATSYAAAVTARQ